MWIRDTMGNSKLIVKDHFLAIITFQNEDYDRPNVWRVRVCSPNLMAEPVFYFDGSLPEIEVKEKVLELVAFQMIQVVQQLFIDCFATT